MAATVVAYVRYAKKLHANVAHAQQAGMRDWLSAKDKRKILCTAQCPCTSVKRLLNVSATVNAVELEFTFRSICLLMCLETGAYSECRMMRSIVSNHSHMVRIFSVRILAVGSHRRFAVCGSHFRVRQFAVRILEQPLFYTWQTCC